MDDRDLIELRLLDREVCRLELQLLRGDVSERAARLRLEVARHRQRELRQGLAWAGERARQAILK